MAGALFCHSAATLAFELGYPGLERYSIVRTAHPPSSGLLLDLVKILLSNDDGYRAEGLQALRQAIKPLGAVTVVAPDRNRSGASNSLTLDVPVRAARYDTDCYYVNGTPTDCVHLAISGLFDFEHDIVVSGVNDGANLGDDTLYSGTVAAAVEGRFLGLPAIAVSLCVEPGSPRNFAGAARVAASLIQRLSVAPLQGPGGAQRQCAGSARRSVARHQGHAARQPPSQQADRAGQGSAGPQCLLGGQCGRRAGRRARAPIFTRSPRALPPSRRCRSI